MLFVCLSFSQLNMEMVNGFLCESPDNYRDVALLGDVQDSVEQLASSFGWKDELACLCQDTMPDKDKFDSRQAGAALHPSTNCKPTAGTQKKSSHSKRDIDLPRTSSKVAALGVVPHSRLTKSSGRNPTVKHADAPPKHPQAKVSTSASAKSAAQRGKNPHATNRMAARTSCAGQCGSPSSRT